MNKKPLLPKAQITLTFVANKWNPFLWQCNMEGRSIATIENYSHTNDGGFDLYTDFPRNGLIHEGLFNTKERAESRANWRANIS